MLGFLQTGVTIARTDGYTGIIKQPKRVGCVIRNLATTNAG